MVAVGTVSGQQLLVGWLIPNLQALFLFLGQREVVHWLVDGRDQLGVDRGEGSVGDVPAPESAADEHAKSVGVDVLDAGGGFDDAASEEAGLLPGQFGAGEGVGEDVVVQTRDTAKPINRDGAGFTEKFNVRRVSKQFKLLTISEWSDACRHSSRTS